MKRGDAGGTHGGVSRRRRHISGKPWKIYCLRAIEGDRVRRTSSRGQGWIQCVQVSGSLEMLGQRRETPRWVKDPRWRLYMLG